MPVKPKQTDTMYDVVIIGAGAAGITLALQLGEAGIKTALVEGGGYELTDQSQDLYQGLNEGITYPLEKSRLRLFGGTTNHWGGWCRPFDAASFNARPAIDYPGWPIEQDKLTPYLDQALGIVDIDSSLAWEPTVSQDPSKFEVALSESDFKEIYFHWSKPTRFGNKYRKHLRDDKNVTVSVNDSLINFEFTADGEIQGAVLRNLETHEDRVVHGKQFVLACGGIENARLLLHVNAQNGVNFGNMSSYLGKYFMEHPHFFDVGEVIIFDSSYRHNTFAYDTDEWQRGFRFFCPTDKFIKQQNMLGSTIRMRMYDNPKDQKPIVDELLAKTTFTAKNYWQIGYMDIVVEQPPLITNSVTLSDEVDELGIAKTILNWRLSDIDYRSARQPLLAFARFLIEADLGRCKLVPWITDDQQDPEQFLKGNYWGHHHMGTTRMASNASDGVVDTDCKLYGTKNLYMAGSSVYPTSDYSNPTLTIVQLALRLADHLKSRLPQ